MLRGDADELNYLLDNGVSIDTRRLSDGWTLLHLAAAEERLNILKVIRKFYLNLFI